ncbi:MAG: hypothetical protein AB4368_10450 [Xenococcaceae cyanobacterium]
MMNSQVFDRDRDYGNITECSEEELLQLERERDVYCLLEHRFSNRKAVMIYC